MSVGTPLLWENPARANTVDEVEVLLCIRKSVSLHPSLERGRQALPFQLMSAVHFGDETGGGRRSGSSNVTRAQGGQGD